MVLKSVLMQLRTTEVPVAFYRDRDGRMSHHKRAGWFSPFLAAWINLRIMFVFRAQYFLIKPGLVLFVLGLLLTLPLSFGSISIGSYTFSLYWQLLGCTLALLGLQSLFSGVLAQVFVDYSGKSSGRWKARFPLHTYRAVQFRSVPSRNRFPLRTGSEVLGRRVTGCRALRPQWTTLP